MGWALMSGSRGVWDFQADSGTSGFYPLLLHILGILQFKTSLGLHVEVPDILLPDVGDQPKEVLLV